MATGPITQLKDLIIPTTFSQYTQLKTLELSELINSGAVINSPYIQSKLANGSRYYEMPYFNDLDNDPDRTSNDSIPKAYTGGVADPDPYKITTGKQRAIAVNRNASWGASDLDQYFIDTNPMTAIANRVSAYWVRRMQNYFISTVKGIYADNDANPTAGEHVKGDLTHDVKANAFKDNSTNFTTVNFLDTMALFGDGIRSSIDTIMVHSVVYVRMIKLNLIATVRDANSPINYATFMGKRIIVDDAMPNAGGIYQTWLFGNGAFHFGSGNVAHATAVERHEGSGNGGGAETLYNRVRWCMHPDGYSFIANPASAGGPTNAELEDAGSWQRSYRERKMIRMARLITRESA